MTLTNCTKVFPPSAHRIVHLVSSPLFPPERTPIANWINRVLFFLLYFNRLFATLLSYAIRAYTWHYYRAYVDIHALQIPRTLR